MLIGSKQQVLEAKVNVGFVVITKKFERTSKLMSQLNEQIVLQRIQAEMDRYLLEHDAPEEILGFLHHHWARLLAGIFLVKGNQHPDWTAGWDAVNALLWSLAPKVTRDETQQMLQMLPTLLARLHEGCAALMIASPECDALFSRLALMHAAVARAGLRCGNVPEKGITHIAQASQMDGNADLSKLNPPRRETFEFAAPPALGAAMPLPELKIGDRVHFRQGVNARTLSLNWVSPAGGMYLFGNDQGLDAITMTRARLTERFAQGNAALVSD